MFRRQAIGIRMAFCGLVLLECSKGAEVAKAQPPIAAVVEPSRKPPSLVALTSAATGQVFLLERETLELIRTVEPEKRTRSAGPMLVAEDEARRVYYVGNYNGGLGRIPMDGGSPASLDLGGALIGLAISPDGRLLAVNGAHDLTMRLVDLDRWELVASHRFGTPTDEPLHSPLTHGMASTHPVWLRDGSGVLVEDNIHEQVVLIGPDGKERARQKLRTAVHTFLATPTGEILAMVEGTIDRKLLPSVVVLDGPGLNVVREIVIPLEQGEPAKLHHGSISPDGEIVVVANMGPMHGEKTGTTVAALRWRTGDLLWHVPTVRNSGHVRFLDASRVIVLGHRDPNLAVLDAATGKRLATWPVPGATSLGHSLAEEPGGSVLVIDSSVGRLVRVASDGVKNQSPALGKDVSEASLSE